MEISTFLNLDETARSDAVLAAERALVELYLAAAAAEIRTFQPSAMARADAVDVNVREGYGRRLVLSLRAVHTDGPRLSIHHPANETAVSTAEIYLDRAANVDPDGRWWVRDELFRIELPRAQTAA